MLLSCFAALTFLSTTLWNLSYISLLTGGSGNEAQRQAWMAAGTAVLAGLSLLYVRLLARGRADAAPAKAPALACGFFFTLFSLALFLAQRNLHAPAGADPNNGLEAAFFLGAGALWCLAWRRRSFPPWLAVLAALFALDVMLTRRTLAFPMDNGFSDMLLLVRAAGRSLLDGSSPYGVQHLVSAHAVGAAPVAENIRTTYLPGLWLQYLPCVALGLDLRLMNLVFWAAFCVLAYRALDPDRRALGAGLLSLFFLNPWLAYRQDLYLPAYLWILALFYWALKRGRPRLAALAFGLGMASYPFSWPVFPIWLAWTAGSQGRGQALRRGALSLAVALALILPFALWDPRGFYEGVLGHWAGAGALEFDHYNLAYWLRNLPGRACCLWAVQAADLLAAALLARRHASLGALFGLAAAFLAVFLLANYHVSHYFFFIVAAYLLMATAEWPKQRVRAG